jgi:hypothetical protein
VGHEHKRIFLFVVPLFVALLGCATDPDLSLTGTVKQALVGPGDCFDAMDYGASAWLPGVAAPPNSREAIQTAADAAASAGGRLCKLPAGRFYVDRAPAGSYNRFAAISFHSPELVLEGQGRETEIIAFGDAGASAFYLVSFDPGCENCGIANVKVSTRGLFNTDAGEQTYAIVVGSSVCDTSPCTKKVRNTLIDHVAIDHPIVPGERMGDAIHVFGNTPASAAENTRILNVDFLSAGRAAVGIQRNAVATEIAHSYFQLADIGGTAIDDEATGGEWVTGLSVHHNFMWGMIAGHDAFAISGTSLIDGSIDHNVIVGTAAINCYRCVRTSIDHNILDSTVEAPNATTANIELANICETCSVDHNQTRRRGAAGQCIKAQPHSGGYPGPLTIDHNICINETDGAAVMVGGANDLTIDANTLIGNGGPNSMGVYVFAVGRTVEQTAVTNNRIRGMAYAAVRMTSVPVTGGGYSFLGSLVALNTSRASGPFRCDNPTALTPGGIVAGLNNWSAAAVCVVP